MGTPRTSREDVRQQRKILDLLQGLRLVGELQQIEVRCEQSTTQDSRAQDARAITQDSHATTQGSRATTQDSRPQGFPRHHPSRRENKQPKKKG